MSEQLSLTAGQVVNVVITVVTEHVNCFAFSPLGSKEEFGVN